MSNVGWKLEYISITSVSLNSRFLAILICRNLLGEDLGPLNVKELEQLENQIEISLKHIRSSKVANENCILAFMLSTSVKVKFTKFLTGQQ